MNALKNRKMNIKSILFTAVMIAVCAATCVCLFCLNITKAVALEQELRCGIEEHVHTDGCYDGDFLVCEKPLHSHDRNCYIVLLNENDINGILSLLEEGENRSLESVIADVMTTVLTYNKNLNTQEDSLVSAETEAVILSQNTVAEFNSTISEDASLPGLVLNENMNTIETLALEDTVPFDDIDIDNSDGNSGRAHTSLLDVGDEAVSSDYYANFYVYLDGWWTFIGSLAFETERNGNNRYNSTLATRDVLALVNGALGTEFTYNSFDISVSSSLNGTYSKSNIGIGSITTTVGYRQSRNTANATKYVRLIPDNGSASSTAFAFYTVKYVYLDGNTSTRYVRSGTTITLPTGDYEWTTGDTTYAAGEAVTITGPATFSGVALGPITYVSINYDVDFPAVSGVTVSTEPTISGLATERVTDGYTEGASAVIRNVSEHSVEGKVDGNSTGLSRVIQFKGWQVGDTDIILQPNTTLVWEELLQYATGASVNLTAVWEYSSLQTAGFYVRFDSVAVDTEGNITGQDQNLYTDELFASYVGGIDTSLSYSELHDLYYIADTTADNSYGADQKIRALYGEKSEGVWLYGFPSDDYVFEQLKEYAETGYLSVDGKTVKAEDLNKNSYAIRWYVFKCQSDAWHIDGKLVKKEGLIHVYKTFAGNKELIAEAKEGFYIDAGDADAENAVTLDWDNYTSYNSDTDTYMWEIGNVDYGELWELTEHPDISIDESEEFSIYSEYTVTDALGDQSAAGTGTSLTVTGMTYALDEGVDGILRVEFTNIYNKSNSIVIKKQDSLTGVSIGGATFQLLQNGKVLRFRYNSTTGSYEYDPENGTQTVLSGTANGYFEISIEDFSYDLGPITIREITSPDGYIPIGDIEVGYIDDEKTVGILSGNSDLIKYVNGILIVGNSTDALSVTAKKSWSCPESEWQDVTVRLLANGKLVTAVIAGVQPQVILNADNNWTYTWENLPVYVNGDKIEWSVKETRVGSEDAKADGTFINWLVSYELPVYSTDAEGNENILLTITNTTKRVMLRVTKTDLNKSVQLAGAAFRLEAVDESGTVLDTEVAKTAMTGAAGTLVFDNLKCRIRYRLTEVTAPDGYIKTDEYIYFTINEDGAVTVEESDYAQAGTSAYNIIVWNAEVISLPETGSVGMSMFYAVGLLLLLTAGIYIRTLRKRRC